MPLKQIPLLGSHGIHLDGDVPSSSGAGLPYYVNGFFEIQDTAQEDSRKVAYVKRQGVSTNVITGTITAGYLIAGMISSLDRNIIHLYTNNGTTNKVYTYNGASATLTDRGAAPAAAGSWVATRQVVFTHLDGISYGAYYYAVTDFTKGAVVAGDGVWTEITDADFTGLTKRTNLVGLDGYLFVGTSNNRIYNSDLNAPTSWTALGFISAAETPGKIRWLGVIRNYLIVFKDRSIEFFEDVGNPTPGSPLESRKQFNVKIGCPLPQTIREVSDGIIFAGTTETNTIRLYKISKNDLSIKPISNRYIEQMLSISSLPLDAEGPTSYWSNDSVFATKQSYTTAYRLNGQSQTFTIGGKEFYTINLHNPNNVSTANYTQVYDNTLNVWTSWTSSTATTQTDDASGFQFSQAQIYSNSGTFGPIFADNNPVTLGGAGSPRVLAMTPGAPTWLDKGSSTDNIYNFSWASDVFDFGNRKRKFMDSVEIHYDVSSENNITEAGNLTMTFGYRDDNHNTNTRVTRTINLDSGGGVRAIIRRLGSFRRRVFDFLFSAAGPLRIWSIEVQYNQGETDQEG